MRSPFDCFRKFEDDTVETGEQKKDELKGLLKMVQGKVDEFVNKNIMCTIGEEQRDTCQGDSGGPIVTNRFGAVLGIQTWIKKFTESLEICHI